MTTKDPRQQMAKLLGLALQRMAGTDVPAEALGTFAIAFQADLEAELGVSGQRQEPDLVEIVAKAVDLALDRRDGIQRPGVASIARSPSFTRLTVKVGGKRTSLSINCDLIAQLDERVGGRAGSVEFVNQLLADAPKGNRSGWAAKEISAFLAGERQSAANSSASSSVH